MLLGEVMVDVGKVLEPKARRPLSPPVTPLLRGRRAEGVRDAYRWAWTWSMRGKRSPFAGGARSRSTFHIERRPQNLDKARSDCGWAGSVER